jgi:hypothetical protein
MSETLGWIVHIKNDRPDAPLPEPKCADMSEIGSHTFIDLAEFALLDSAPGKSYSRDGWTWSLCGRCSLLSVSS